MDSKGGIAPFSIISPYPIAEVGDLWVVDLRNSLPTNGVYTERTLVGVKYLVVHHSGVVTDSSAWSIAQYHISKYGWPGIGYHFLVHQDGMIEYVGDIHQVRYNVASRNHEIIGICLPGNWMYVSPSTVQLISTKVLLKALKKVLNRSVPIVAHWEIAVPGWETECCGDTYEDDWKYKIAA